MSGEFFDRYQRANRQTSRPSGRLWNPAADVYRTHDGWIVKVDLAGIQTADVEVAIDGPLLRVSGLGPHSGCRGGVSHYYLGINQNPVLKIHPFSLPIRTPD